MPWMSKEQGLLLLNFLEINPPTNNHGNLKTRFLCFYSSEMKNLKQITANIEKIVSSQWQAIESGAQRRYQNTLKNLALITGEANHVVLSKHGQEVFDFIRSSNVGPNDLNHETPENKSACKNIEKIILQNLIKEVADDESPFIKAKEYGKKLLFELDNFYSNFSQEEFQEAIGDLDRLLFLQIINSSGVEVRRYLNTSPQMRLDGFNAWRALKDSPDFPDDCPIEAIEKMAFLYTKPIQGNAIQSDIRYRVSNCLQAYKEIIDEKTTVIPEISRDYLVIQKQVLPSPESNMLPPKQAVNELKIPNQLIVSGCPGSGKSWYLRELINTDNDVQSTTITLHPDYAYSDFVGCYKPVPVYEESSKVKRASGESFSLGVPKINYEFVSGPFIDAYILAYRNPSYNVVLTIEEINRTNCNTLFGDMFQLLDRDSTNRSEHEIQAMPDLREYLVAQGLEGTIRLTSNLYICGTMNSADQGVFPLDSAFRRRWEFQYRGYKTTCEYRDNEQKLIYGGSEINWDDFRGKINESLIKLGIHEDKLIGPYFLTVKELANPSAILNKLFLFLWDDVLRFERKEILDFVSFAEVSENWNNGSGTPLKIDLGA